MLTTAQHDSKDGATHSQDSFNPPSFISEPEREAVIERKYQKVK